MQKNEKIVLGRMNMKMAGTVELATSNQISLKRIIHLIYLSCT
jgi:hypothetical protein